LPLDRTQASGALLAWVLLVHSPLRAASEIPMKRDQIPSHDPSASATPAELVEVDLLGETPIWTPEIERLTNSACTQIRLGFPGMAVDGQQRCGKTSACEFLRDTLSQALGYPIATVMWTIPEFAKTERDFVQERLRDSECHAVSHRDIAVLRNRLYDHIADLAAQAGGRKVSIIVDEAHNLSREQYHYLIHCDNALRMRKVKPFFVLVGQPELRSTTSSWMKSSGYQVVGRFFARQHTYMGIALPDVLTVVQGFDEPESEGALVTYAKSLPDAFAAGWRLSQVAALLVEAIGSIAAKHNITNGVRVPMQNLRAMLLSILWHFISTKANPATFNLKMAIGAVMDSGFPSVMEYYVHGGAVPTAKED
jgi:hypothetical protein